jgi:pimeloyl-ACP methyl ester carboxylesterase
MPLKLFIAVFLWFSSCRTIDKIFIPNYNEGRVPQYTLPDALIFENGEPVESLVDWQKRRKQILRLFEKEVYGIAPRWDGDWEVELIYENDDSLEGIGLTREFKITLYHEDRQLDYYLLLHLPISDTAVPVFLGYNFFGNHTTTFDPGVRVSTAWMRNNPDFFITANRADEQSRGLRLHRWPAKEIVERGYGLATVYYGDIDPDFDDGFDNGVHELMDTWQRKKSWGTIAAWSWGLSRVMDFFETFQDIDHNKVIVMGHSRNGKAALWAAAVDERFAMVISNNSGCGGAALSRRKFGETVSQINRRYPHWFAGNFKDYNHKEHKLPVDQHQLLALIAPRPLYVASAENDRWADPRGEFLSCVEATPVYKLFGLEGLPVNEMPQINQPVYGTIGYHIRSGGHNITLYDWMQYLNFADLHLKINSDTHASELEK